MVSETGKARADHLMKTMKRWDYYSLRKRINKGPVSLSQADEMLVVVPAAFRGEKANALFPKQPIPYGSPLERSVCHRDGVPHYTSHVILANEEGAVLTQRRNYQREHGGGKLSASAGGHMKNGRIPLEAAVEEAREELGLGMNIGDLNEVGRYWYLSQKKGKKYTNQELVSLFIAWAKGKIKPQREEVLWVKPLSLGDLSCLMTFYPGALSEGFKKDLRLLERAMKEKGVPALPELIRNLSEDPTLF